MNIQIDQPLYILLIGNTPLHIYSDRAAARVALALQRAAWLAANPGGAEPDFWVMPAPFKGQ